MSAGDYEVLDLTSWDVVSDETAGADEKLWLMELDSEAKWLFKPVTIKAGHRHGEDWAEKAASELAHTEADDIGIRRSAMLRAGWRRGEGLLAGT